jgi:SAM-dependent methyltransferase
VLPPLQRGRAEAAARGVSVGYVQADLTAPLPAEVFDAVVSLECLMEVPDDTAALRSMVAALRPGGRFVAQVPTRDWTPVLRGSERAWRREVRHGYDRAELLRWLSGNGLVVESVDGTFHRLTALAQDVRDAVKGRRVWLRAALAPAYLLAVELERRGLRIGRPRAWLVVATKG